MPVEDRNNEPTSPSALAAARRTGSPLNAFLSGVTVLDLSQYIPGPMASLVLADMGARVIKVEPPHGDEMRRLGPRDAAGRPIFYTALNAGKELRFIDLKSEAGQQEFRLLAREADVLIEGFRPGVTARLGIDYATLNRINPGLVYCSMSGYGAGGPDRLKAAHDANYLATSGVLHRNGSETPSFYDPPLADTSGSLYAAIVILGALQARNASGRGCEIDLGLADVLMPLQMLQVADYGATGHVPARRSTYLNGGAAYYQVYRLRCARHVMLGSVEPKFWRAFCTAAARPDWIDRHSEPTPQAALTAELTGFFGALDLDEVERRFAGVDCCLTPVLDLAEALASAQTRARSLVRAAPADGSLQALFPAWVDGLPPGSRPPLAQQAPTERPATNQVDGCAADGALPV